MGYDTENGTTAIANLWKREEEIVLTRKKGSQKTKNF